MTLNPQPTDSTQSNVPQKKKSFFNKPKWAAPAESKTRSDFYRRADQTYVDIIAAETREPRRHRGRSKPIEGGDSGGDLPRDTKRRRISESEPDELDPRHSNDLTKGDATSPDTLGFFPSDKPGNEEKVVQVSRVASSHVSTPEKSIPRPTAHRIPDNAAVIDLDAEDSEPAISSVPSPAREEPGFELDDDPLAGEEEFPELARKARERALQNLTKPQKGPSLPNNGGDNGSLSKSPDPSMNDGDASRKETVVQILITSNITNTTSLIVQRKLSQRLRDVRLVWCKRQGFNEEMTATVFLTWRGTRLFDVTTCKSLGVQPGDNDQMFMDDDISKEEEDIRVHMEAVTEEIFEAQKRQAREREGTMEHEEEKPADDDVEEEIPERVRLTLRNPDLEEFKIIVKPTTQISRIMSTFAKTRKISPEATVYLLFDGERLNPNSYVKDNDIADLDSIDVQIK